MYRNVVPSAVTQRVVTAFRAELRRRARRSRRGHAGRRRRSPRLTPEAVSRFLVGGFMEVLRSWMEDPDPTDLSGRVAAALDTVNALLGHSPHNRKVLDMAKHQAPERHPLRDRAAIRTTALAMIGLTVFVIAMIASYSGAFAKPTLHHMAVAVAGPQRLVDGIRGQETLAVTEVGDAAAARDQVYERKTDAAFVVAPTGEMKIYVAGGGGHSVATAAETVGRTVAAKAGLRAAVEDVAPGVGSRSVRHRRVLRHHLHLDRCVRRRNGVRTSHGHRPQTADAGAADRDTGRLFGAFGRAA